jgi:hypothetical protein
MLAPAVARAQSEGAASRPATAARADPESEPESGRSRLLRWLTRRPRAIRPVQESRDARAGAATATGADQPPPAVFRPGTPGSPELSGVALNQPGGAPSAPAEAAGPSRAVLQPPPAVPAAPTPLLLNRALDLQDAPVRVFGWIQNSVTANANGVPPSRTNFGVFPNHLADQWMGNQYYFVVEDPLEQVDVVNFGFRVDTLFGNDWSFTKDYGLFDRAWHNNSFPGIDLPQIYGEVHLPVLTSGGLDLRGGRFYSLTGFESPQAIARPLLSVPYMMNFTPFTFFGAVATLHINERLNFFSGAIDGFDRWIDASYKWGYLGAVTWTSRDKKTTFVVGGADAPDQLPRFAPANSPAVPVGTPTPGFLAGRINPLYGQSRRGYIVAVLTRQWSERLTQAMETDHVFDPTILGIGPNPAAHSASYHSFGNWFLYALTDKLTAVWRSEIFWDPDGLATGVADTFHEMTVGLQYRPEPWLWIRPEARYDWTQFTRPFNDGTRKSQLTLGIDAIILF